MSIEEDCPLGCSERWGHKPQCPHFETRVGTTCPDSARCHHQCQTVCWRVAHTGPLSWAAFPADRWPEVIQAEHGVPTPQGTLYVAQGSGDIYRYDGIDTAINGQTGEDETFALYRVIRGFKDVGYVYDLPEDAERVWTPKEGS